MPNAKLLVPPCLAALALLTCGPAAPGPSRPQPPPPTAVERERAAPPPRRAPPPRVTWSGFFTGATLRVDLEHRGNQAGETYRVTATVLEGAWPGSRTRLVDPFDFGAHRFEVRDAETGALLYSRGFSSLFGEWVTTGEAKGAPKAFSESVRFPQPKRPFALILQSRQRSGTYVRVLETRLDPAGPAVIRWKARPDAEVLALSHSGAPADRLDVLVLGDGYTLAEREKFRRDAARFAEVLFADGSFGPHKHRMNVRALFVPSPVSGVSEPRKGLVKKTPLGLSFNTFDSPRYLMTEANLALRDLAAHAPYDALYLMANTSRYGGGGIYNLYATFPSDNEYDEYVFIHEFGHSFAGLGDEYYDSDVSYDDSEFYPKGVEPWEPNITRHLGGRIKWRDLLSPGAPLPTPNLPRHDGVVGLFEGAGYSAKGLYRSQWNCKMKGKGHAPFCKVCSGAIARMMDLYSEGGSRP